MIATNVAGDLKQPGLEACNVAQPGQAEHHFHEDCLTEIFVMGIVSRLHDHETRHALLIAPDQRFERFSIAAAAPVDQVSRSRV